MGAARELMRGATTDERSRAASGAARDREEI
jgi:hypothetical protein